MLITESLYSLIFCYYQKYNMLELMQLPTTAYRASDALSIGSGGSFLSWNYEI